VGFAEFLGNGRIVAALRGMLRAERVPHAMLFSGPRGVGKYTLARMFAQAANCERLADDFCGACATCLALAPLANPDVLLLRGLEERGASPDTATIERTPLLLQPHPDVCVVVPDPVRKDSPVKRPVIRMGQLRAVQRAAYFRPQGRRRVFIIDGAETMRWDLASIFLKILEEPPETATLILLAPNPYLLLTTIQSRCLRFAFAPVPAAEIETMLKSRSELSAAERRLVAQLSSGSVGDALTLDLEESTRLRGQALRLVELGLAGRPLRELFALTAQLVRNERVSFEKILELLYTVVSDLLELSQSSAACVLRNPDLRKELEALSRRTTLAWAQRAAAALDTLQERLRRNVNRQLGLDSMMIALGDR
jgi:DNA polymerase-3 subunit delta'